MYNFWIIVYVKVYVRVFIYVLDILYLINRLMDLEY